MTPTKTSKIAKALLDGEVITIMDAFKRFAVTNFPREAGRQIERKFGVALSRDRVDFTHDCGLPGWYYRYRLNRIDSNESGIRAMEKYVEANLGNDVPVKRPVGRPKEKKVSIRQDFKPLF